jgi:ribosomal protein L40E
MRTLVDPPPALRCERCNGELRFKKIEQHTSLPEFDVSTFVCTKCGAEKSSRTRHDPHSAPCGGRKPSEPTASRMSVGAWSAWPSSPVDREIW